MPVKTKMPKIDKVAALGAEEMLAEPLSPTSFFFARMLSTHIVVTIGLVSPIDIDVFRAQLPLALNHPRFSSVMVEGVRKGKEELKWVQNPQVNIDNHIVIPSINSVAISNNRLKADEFVEDYLQSLTKTSLDVSKLPWEIHLLNLKTSEAESLVIFRIHHSLGDGMSVASHLIAWARQVSNPNALPTIAMMKNKKKTMNKEDVERDDNCYRFWKLSWSVILAVWWWLQVLCNTIIDVLMFSATIFFLKDSDILTISHRETNTMGRRIVYKVVSLDDMKLIKNAMNVTINDVAIGIIEAGISRYLIRRFGNGNTKEVLDSENMLKKLRLRSVLAVNLRPMKGIQGLEDIKNKDTKLGLGNKLGFVIVPLSIGSRDDPLEYVRRAKAVVDRKKRSLEAKANYEVCELAMKLFGSEFAGSMTLKMLNHVSLTVSNMPGPVEETALFGHTLKFIAPTIYGYPSPILIHLQSCANKMTFVVSVREDVMVDPHQLSDDIVESLLLIRDAAGSLITTSARTDQPI